MAIRGSLKNWALSVKRDVHAIYLAARDPRTPWYAKALALFIAGYVLSPIDLIPDFIPILGYLDDAIIVPLGVILVIRMIPPDVMAQKRIEAEAALERPASRAAAAIIVGLWIVAGALAGWIAYHYFSPR